MAHLTCLKLERIGDMLHMEIHSENNSKDIMFTKEVPKYICDFIRRVLEEELE